MITDEQILLHHVREAHIQIVSNEVGEGYNRVKLVDSLKEQDEPDGVINQETLEFICMKKSKEEFDML